MARLHDDVAPQLPGSLLDPGGQWTRLWLQPLLDVQRVQWDVLLRWQESIATMSRDVCEQWAVRCLGGVPIE